jgi:tetratricopeptide (TPR) repeat protein
MFVHIVKDFHKKLDAIEQRLAVSLDRDEIQTLGLKLRFYHNELKHYKNLLGELHSRVTDIQEKYGFQPEESSAAETDKAAAAGAPDDRQDNAASMVSDWIARLEKKGIDPRELLKNPGAPIIKEQKKPEVQQQPAPETAPKSQEKTTVAAFSTQNAAIMYKKSFSPPDTPPSEPIAVDVFEKSEDVPEQQLPDSMPPTTAEEHGPDSPVVDSDAAAAAETPVLSFQSALPLESQPVRDKADAHESPMPDAAEKTEPGESAEAGADETPEIEPAQEVSGTAEPAAPPVPEHIEKIKRWLSLPHGAETAHGEIDAEVNTCVAWLAEETYESMSGWPNDEFEKIFSPDEAGLAIYFAARLFIASGRTGTAINLLESAARRQFETPEIYLLLGDLYFEKELLDRAMQHYKKARELGAVPAASWDRRIQCMREAGDWVSIASEVDAFGAGGADMTILKSEALHAVGNTDEASKLLEDLIGWEDAEPAGRANAAILMGKIREDKNDILGAIDFYEKCFLIDPSTPRPHYELGRLYFKHNAMPLGKNQMMTLLKKFPESEWADRARQLMAREGVL